MADHNTSRSTSPNQNLGATSQGVALRVCDHANELETLTRLVKHAHGSVMGNRSRMQKEFTNCKGVLATSAWADAITKMTDWMDEVERLFPELKMENRMRGGA